MLFRYQTKQFNSGLLTMGNIRVGTLHDFRRIEHKIGISDPKEGKKIVKHSLRKTTKVIAGDKNALILKDLGINVTKSASFTNCDFSLNLNHPDCFILCLSSLDSKNTMAQFENANSCVKIINEEKFFSSLTESLNKRIAVKFMGVQEVIYQSREEWHNGINLGISPALIKEPKFSRQKEARAIWIPQMTILLGKEIPIDPQIIIDHRLAECCREHPLT